MMEVLETMPGRADEVANRAAAERLMRAMRERDYVTIADLLAPDVVVSSPITGGFKFHGRDDVMALLEIVRGAMQDLEHHDLVGADDVWYQGFRMQVRGRAIEGVDMMRFDPSGKVRELTVFVRPLPGVAVFAAALATPIGRRRGLLTAIVLRLLTAPLALITHQGDRLVGSLLRGTWGAGGPA